LTHIKQQKLFLARQGPWIKYTVLIMSTALYVPERIFAVLHVSIMGLTRCYKTTVFLHLYLQFFY